MGIPSIAPTMDVSWEQTPPFPSLSVMQTLTQGSPSLPVP